MDIEGALGQFVAFIDDARSAIFEDGHQTATVSVKSESYFFAWSDSFKEWFAEAFLPLVSVAAVKHIAHVTRPRVGLVELVDSSVQPKSD